MNLPHQHQISDSGRILVGQRLLSQHVYTPEKAAADHGKPSHRYIGNVIYGGLDGIITTFAVVSGVVGAEFGADIILVLGLANLLADGASMAAGAYLANRSEQEYYERERRREEWQIVQYPDTERDVLASIYTKAGYASQDAQQLVEIQARHPERWATTMLVEELGLLADERNPFVVARVTFVAFVVSGSVPLLVYLAGLLVPISAGVSFAIAVGLSGVALFCLGAAKYLVTERNAIRSGIEMLLVGGLAAAIAYIVGVLLRGID